MILLDDDEYLKKYYAFTHLKKKDESDHRLL